MDLQKLIEDETLDFVPVLIKNKVGYHVKHLGNKYTYLGQVNTRDMKEGYGRRTWPDGEIHEGYYIDDLRNGY